MSNGVGRVRAIRVLKMPKEKEALHLLQKVASLVKPIMEKHGWTLPELAEFFPDNPGLLGININAGQKICIRLRPTWAPDTFLGLEDELVGTMLHELTHNVHGPHDEKFYKFLESLQSEYDGLRFKGYSGEGFFGEGKRLGQGESNDRGLSIDAARRRAADMAEKRAKQQAIMGNGGRTLGGPKPIASPREMAARAAERRAKDSLSCGHGDHNNAEIQKEVEKAEKDGEILVLDDLGNYDLDLDPVPDAESIPPSAYATNQERPSKVPRTVSPPEASTSSLASSSRLLNNSGQARPTPNYAARPSSSSSNSTKPTPNHSTRPQGNASAEASTSKTSTSALNAGSANNRAPSPPVLEASAWECPACTFINENPLSLQCEVCHGVRPSPPSSATNNRSPGSNSNAQRTPKPVSKPIGGARLGGGTIGDDDDDRWFCHKCGCSTDNSFWSCMTCGTIKLAS